jgi:hypothetical protein
MTRPSDVWYSTLFFGHLTETEEVVSSFSSAAMFLLITDIFGL